MYQLIPAKYFWVVAAWATITILVLLDATTSLGMSAKARQAVAGVNILFIVLTLKPVWRLLWRVPLLKSYFPDLNGLYEVEYQSNWPIQERMLAAASGKGEAFDPLAPNRRPSLQTYRTKGLVDVSFYGVRLTIFAPDPDDPRMTIDNSRTLTASLMKAREGEPNRFTYIYQQRNRRDRQVIGDDSVFEGAALLTVGDGGDVLHGEYWTNRAWQNGLSTAGKICFRRLRTAPLIGKCSTS